MKSNKSLRLITNHSMEKTSRPYSAYTSKPYVINSKNHTENPQILYTMPSQSKGMGSKIEKEQLYEQTMQLKKRVNKLKAELDEAKSTIVKKDIELRKKEKIIDDLSKENDVQIVQEENMNKARESTLLTLCKRKYYEMKKKYEGVCEENEILKSNIKITKIKELKIVTEVLESELDKMKNLYIHSKEQNKNNLNEISDLQEFKIKFFQQHEIIQSLQQNCEEANFKNKESNGEIGKLREKMAKNDAEFKKLKIENQKLKATNEKYLNEKKRKEKFEMNQGEDEQKIQALQSELSQYKQLYNQRNTENQNLMQQLEGQAKSSNKQKMQNLKPFDHNAIKSVETKNETDKDKKLNLYKNIIKDQNIKLNIYEEYISNSGKDPVEVLRENQYEGVINSKNTQKAKGRPLSSLSRDKKNYDEEEEQKVEEIDLADRNPSKSENHEVSSEREDMKKKYTIPQNEEDTSIDPEKMLLIFKTNLSGRHSTKEKLTDKLNQIYQHFEKKNEASPEEFVEPFLNLLKEEMKVTQSTDIEYIKEFLNILLDNLKFDTGRFFETFQSLFEQTVSYDSIQNESDLNNELISQLKDKKDDLIKYLKYNTIEAGNTIDFVIFDIIMKKNLKIEMDPYLYSYLLYKMKEEMPESASIFNLNYNIINDLMGSETEKDNKANTNISKTDNLDNISSGSSKSNKDENNIEEKSNESKVMTEEKNENKDKEDDLVNQEDEIENVVVNQEDLNKTMGHILSTLIYSYKQFDILVDPICEEVKDENGVTVRGIAYEDLNNKFKEIGVDISETDRKYIIKTYRMKNSKLINADKLKSDLNKTNIKYLDTERVI